MALTTYTLDELTDRYRGTIRGLYPSADTSPPSPWYITARLCAVLHHAAQGMTSAVLRNVIPKTADRSWIVELAEARGLALAEATVAIGKIQIVGTVASVQGSGSAVTAPDGTAYKTTAGVALATPAFTGKTVGSGSGAQRLIVLPNTTNMLADEILEVNGEKRAIRSVIATAGAVDLYEPLTTAPTVGDAIAAVTGAVAPIAADVAGATGNKLPGETMTITSPGAGVTAATRLVECSGGGDLETIEELRAHCIAYDRDRPAAGNAGWWRELARTTPGVRLADAFVYPGYRGLGTIDIIPWGVKGARYTGSEVNALIQARVDEARAWADDVLVRSFFWSSPLRLDLEVFVHPDFAPDFVGQWTIGGGASTVSRVYVTTTPVGTIAVGDRVLIPVQSPSGFWRTYQREVAAVTATYLDLADDLPAAPANGDPVTSGGPNAEELITAAEDHFDSVGPGVYYNVIADQAESWWERTPNVDEGYPGTLYLNGIRTAIRAVPGVADLDVDNLDGDSTPDDYVATPQTVPLLGKLTIVITKAAP